MKSMSNGTGFVTQRKKVIGDVAVDGLLAGMGAGVIMGLLLAILGLLDGSNPVELLGRFDPAGQDQALVGGLMHLAMSAIYGVLFAIVYHFLAGRWAATRRWGWLIGAGYGLALWLAAQFVFLPRTGAALAEIAPLHFALGHLAYGEALGYLLGRQERA
jgi:hypothetical protein